MKSQAEANVPQNDGPRSIQFTPSKLPGCFVVQFPIVHDARGHFVKTVQSSVFKAQGLESSFKECFFTTSRKDVLRGMHFQMPPSDHAKLVYCTSGSIYDMALDLRVGSPTYGDYEIYELSSNASNAVYLPQGIAHGFYVREGPATMVYHVTSEHDAARDAGVLWSSFGAVWPTEEPVLSRRDSSFPKWKDFKSPFRFSERPSVPSVPAAETGSTS